jgi:hypothetical protein
MITNPADLGMDQSIGTNTMIDIVTRTITILLRDDQDQA